MYWENPEMMIRNQDSITQMAYNLNTFGNINQELLNVLFTSDSTSKDDPIIEEFLQSSICKYLDADIQETCIESTQGDSLGLLGFNLKYYTTSSNYVNLFDDDKSLDNVKMLVSSYFDSVIEDLSVLDRAYNFLTLHILEVFHQQVKTLESLNLLLSMAAILFIIITTIVIQTITLSTLIKLDNSQKKLFRSLTYYVFSQNKSVGFLLKKEFGDEVEGLNRILYGS